MEKEIDSNEQIIVAIEWLKSEQKYEEAIKVIEENLIKYNDDYRLYEELADIYIYTDKFEKSLKAIDFALELNPESATWNYLKGFLHLANEKIEEAIKYLEKSNNLLWNNSEVLRNLWFSYTLIWKQEKWISILKRALFLNPGDELITEDLAMALIGKWDVLEWNVLLRQIEKDKQV